MLKKVRFQSNSESESGSGSDPFQIQWRTDGVKGGRRLGKGKITTSPEPLISSNFLQQLLKKICERRDKTKL